MKIRKREDTPTGRNETAFELPEKLMPFVKMSINSTTGKKYIKITSEQHARVLAQRVAPIDAIKPTDYQWLVVEE